MKQIWIIIPLIAFAGCDRTPDKPSEVVASPTVAPGSVAALATETAPIPPETTPPTPSTTKLTMLGEWMTVGQQCVRQSRNGEYVEGSNLEIQKSSINGFEWWCDLKPALAEGSTSYKGKQVCFGDGAEDTPMAVSLDLLPDGKLKMKTEAGTEILRRCQ